MAYTGLFLRHTLKQGKDGNPELSSPEGLELASQIDLKHIPVFHPTVCFNGELIRTLQTAFAIQTGNPELPMELRDPVPAFGGPGIFSKLGQNKDFLTAIKDGATLWEAGWLVPEFRAFVTNVMRPSLTQLFEDVGDKDFLAILHSPTVEACAHMAGFDIPRGLHVRELQGVLITLKTSGTVASVKLWAPSFRPFPEKFTTAYPDLFL